VITHQVIRSTHPQTGKRAPKKAAKHHHVGRARTAVPREDQGGEVPAEHEEEDGAEEVGVDVYGLVVQVEEGVQGAGEGIGSGPVAGVDGGVVAAPGGEVVPVDCEGGGGFAGGGGCCGGGGGEEGCCCGGGGGG